ETLQSFPIHFFTYSPSRENDFRAPECRWRSGAPFLWAILYNFSKHFLGNLPPAASAHYKISVVPAQKGRECFFRS
uniref:hypothetical protein n=1 Tax=Faecalibacterium prausnitzii TaxID=853 RepID=UPI0040389EC6